MKGFGVVHRLDDAGRLIIPSDLRRITGLDVGAAVDLVVSGRHILVGKCEPACLFCRSDHGVFQFKGLPVCAGCAGQMGQGIATCRAAGNERGRPTVPSDVAVPMGLPIGQRRIGVLGRLKLPPSLMHRLQLVPGDPMEFFLDGRWVVARKYAPGCMICGGHRELVSLRGHNVCRFCRSQLSDGPSNPAGSESEDGPGQSQSGDHGGALGGGVSDFDCGREPKEL